MSSSIRLCTALLRRSVQSRSSLAVRRQARIPTISHFSTSAYIRATSPSPTSSIKNPAEEESQRHLEIGTTALEAGNITDAKTAYERAISIFETPSAHFNLGVCQYHEKDIDSAIQSWKSTLRLSPDSADAHTNLASAYVMSVPSRPDLAIEHLKKAAAITPEDAEVQFNLGAVLEACEQLDESIKAYERAQKGGIERAKENVRNVKAKILAIKMTPKPEGLDEAAKIIEQRREAAAKEEEKQKGEN
jgi:tetratricopeptide (TPR) repeat protein